MSAPLSMSGVPLQGSKLVRIAYFDESGISQNERFTVVAGVVIPGDNWPQVKKALSDLADHCAPPGQRDGFIFHASKLYHGSKHFPRSKYLPQHAREILKSVLYIPADNNLPVVFGWVDKLSLGEHHALPTDESDRALAFHAIAFCECLLMLDGLMLEHFPNECVQVVAEDNRGHRKLLKEVSKYLQAPESKKLLAADMRTRLPLQTIIDVPNFAEKTDSSPLQLGDAAAYAIGRYLEGREDAAEYFDILRPSLIAIPKMDAIEQ